MDDLTQGTGQASAQDPMQAKAAQGYNFEGLGDRPVGNDPQNQPIPSQAEVDPKEVAAGHTTIVPQAPAPVQQPAEQAQPNSENKQEEGKPTNEEAKNSRKSQAEWQGMKEQVEDSKGDAALVSSLKRVLGITEEEAKQAEDPQELMLAKITQLERDSVRKDFEADNPKVRTEQYSEKWKEICALHNDPNHKYHRLDHSDLLSIIERANPELERAEAEYRQQEKSPANAGVPPSGKTSVSSNGLDPLQAQAGAAMGYTEEDYKRAGVL